MASPAGVTADTPGAPPKAPTKEKGRREAGKTAVRPRIVRSVLLAILGAGSGVSVLLGGYYDVTVWGPIALGVLALALALVVTGAGRPRLLPALAVGSLAFLWLFSWLSSTWAESPDQALNYAGRWAFYAAVLLSLLLLMRRREERWIPLTFATAGVVGVALYIVIRMGFGHAAGMFFGGRLRDPLGYVNGQAGYFLLGFWPCVALAEQARSKVLAAVGAAGALVLASLMMLSQTRGVIPGLAFSGLIVFAFVPGRARRVLVLLGIGLALAAIGSPLLDVYNHGALHTDPAKVASAGKAVLLAAVLLAFIWWFVGLVVGGIAGAAAARERSAMVWGERALAAVAVVIAVVGLIALIGNPFTRISKEYDDFVNLKINTPTDTRFLSGGGYRYDYWRIAWKEFKQEPLRGVGAGSYDVDYFVDRRTNEDIRQPHSLPMQLLAELGIPGLLALLAFVGAVFAGLWRTARRGVVSPGRRVAAVAAGGAFSAWLAHTSVDWLHLLPGGDRHRALRGSRPAGSLVAPRARSGAVDGTDRRGRRGRGRRAGRRRHGRPPRRRRALSAPEPLGAQYGPGARAPARQRRAGAERRFPARAVHEERGLRAPRSVHGRARDPPAGHADRAAQLPALGAPGRSRRPPRGVPDRQDRLRQGGPARSQGRRDSRARQEPAQRASAGAVRVRRLGLPIRPATAGPGPRLRRGRP